MVKLVTELEVPVLDQGQLFNRVLTMVSTVAGVQLLLLEFLRRMEV